MKVQAPEPRGTRNHALPGGKAVGLPPRTFLYTLDQLSVMLDMSEQAIKQSHIYFWGRSTGSTPRDLMIARNIAGPGEKPEWRVAEREFTRWMRTKGFKHYEVGGFSN